MVNDDRPSLAKAFALHKAGQLAPALALYEQLLHAQPRAAALLHLAGLAAHQSGQHARAVSWLTEAASLQPGNGELHYHRGEALAGAGRLAEAVGAYREALRLRPDLAAVHNSLGVVQARAGDLPAAAASYKAALAIDPRRPISLVNLGDALAQMHRPEAAMQAYEQAIRVDSGHGRAWLGLGHLYARTKAHGRAIRAYRQALELMPASEPALAGLVYQLQHVAAFAELAQLLPRLDRQTRTALTAGQRPAETPFTVVSHSDDPTLHRAVARAWAARAAADAAARPLFDHAPRRGPKPVLRIGYLCGQWRDHPLIHTLRAVLPRHDRSRVEVHGYAYGQGDGSTFRAEAVAGCDRFTDIHALSLRAAAERIHGDGIDILVDVTGHTQDGRMAILAFRPAPVQVSWLGFLGSSGAAYIDCFLGDAALTPPEFQPFYSERLVTLPDSFMVIAAEPERPPPGRAEEGLPEDGVVLCSFNALYKLDARTFACWLDILEGAPASVLWLLAPGETAQRNLRAAAHARGLDGRLVFAGRRDYHAHLARLGLADLALDTPAYNGGMTTGTLLRAGVPVLTVPGRHAVARMSYSLLQAYPDLAAELVAADLDDYRQRAITLAGAPDRLAGLKRRLLDGRAATPLLDPARFARDLEAAYAALWARFAGGGTP